MHGGVEPRLPHIRRGSKGICNRTHLLEESEAARSAREYYKRDQLLFDATCTRTREVPFWERAGSVGAPTRELARRLLRMEAGARGSCFSFGAHNRVPAYDELLGLDESVLTAPITYADAAGCNSHEFGRDRANLSRALV
eukprot:5153311-Prymnesium_polylepis.1